MSLYSQSNLLILGKLIQIHENFIPKEQALLVKKNKIKTTTEPIQNIVTEMTSQFWKQIHTFNIVMLSFTFWNSSIKCSIPFQGIGFKKVLK